MATSVIKKSISKSIVLYNVHRYICIQELSCYIFSQQDILVDWSLGGYLMAFFNHVRGFKIFFMIYDYKLIASLFSSSSSLFTPINFLYHVFLSCFIYFSFIGISSFISVSYKCTLIIKLSPEFLSYSNVLQFSFELSIAGLSPVSNHFLQSIKV